MGCHDGWLEGWLASMVKTPFGVCGRWFPSDWTIHCLLCKRFAEEGCIHFTLFLRHSNIGRLLPCHNFSRFFLTTFCVPNGAFEYAMLTWFHPCMLCQHWAVQLSIREQATLRVWLGRPCLVKHADGGVLEGDFGLVAILFHHWVLMCAWFIFFEILFSLESPISRTWIWRWVSMMAIHTPAISTTAISRHSCSCLTVLLGDTVGAHGSHWLQMTLPEETNAAWPCVCWLPGWWSSHFWLLFLHLAKIV